MTYQMYNPPDLGLISSVAACVRALMKSGVVRRSSSVFCHVRDGQARYPAE